ncbi:hypothetical protein [Spartinivicinus ruber]|uniref:hypothetical protein n=1 Tax=Spartinivicinus ruber TaxID=2683272 RepID=UPI0013D1987E|nr:hypothetical protein [Spartinivicinus ruber]
MLNMKKILFLLCLLPAFAKAAVCTFPQNEIYLNPGESKLISHTAKNLSYAMYFLDHSYNGSGGLMMTYQAHPGWFKQSRYGFTGSKTNLYTTLTAFPFAASGSRINVSERIIDVSGKTICSGSFVVIIN